MPITDHYVLVTSIEGRTQSAFGFDDYVQLELVARLMFLRSGLLLRIVMIAWRLEREALRNYLFSHRPPGRYVRYCVGSRSRSGVAIAPASLYCYCVERLGVECSGPLGKMTKMR